MKYLLLLLLWQPIAIAAQEATLGEVRTAQREAEEKALTVFDKRLQVAVSAKDVPSIQALRDEIIAAWDSDPRLSVKKLHLILRDCSRSSLFDDDIERHELLRAVVKTMLDQPKTPIPDQITATSFLRTSTKDFPTKGRDALRDDSNALIVQCVRQWAAQVIPKDQLPTSVSANLYPGGDYPAGVAPSAIKEPEIRADYERRLDIEKRKHETLKSQSQMENASRLHFPIIFDYLNEVNEPQPLIKKEIFDQMSMLALPAEQKAWLLKILTEAFRFPE